MAKDRKNSPIDRVDEKDYLRRIPEPHTTDTDAGQEASKGIHDRNRGGRQDRPGSEPLIDREREHRSGYGGTRGEPNRRNYDDDLEE